MSLSDGDLQSGLDRLKQMSVRKPPSVEEVKILEEIAEGRGFWFLDQAALLAMVAYSKTASGSNVLLLPDRVLQCTGNPESPDPAADDIDGCFWTVAASVPAHAGRIEHPAFRAYCD